MLARSQRRRPFVAAASATLLVAVGCFATAAHAAPATTRAAAPQGAGAPITEAQANALGARIADSVAKRDASVLSAALDMNAVATRAVAGRQLPAAFANEFKRGAVEKAHFAEQIVQQMKQNGYYTFLRTRGTATNRRLLFRLLSDSGLNYHEYHLAAGPGGAVRAVDVYVMVSGELLSQTLGRLAAGAAAQMKQGGADGGPAGDTARHYQEFGRMGTLIREGKSAEALAVYDKLPPALRAEKAVLLLRLVSLANVDMPAYQQAIADFQKRFPGDPSGPLLAIDGLFLGKEYDKAMVAIDALDRSLGGDPYLDLYRGNALVARGDPKAARPRFASLAKAWPAHPQAYYALIELSLNDKDFDETARLLTAAEAHANVRFKTIESSEPFAEFVKSPAYKKWAAARQPAK